MERDPHPAQDLRALRSPSMSCPGINEHGQGKRGMPRPGASQRELEVILNGIPGFP